MKKEKKSSYNNYVPKSAKRCKNLGLIFSTQKNRKTCQTEQKKDQKMCKKCLKLQQKKVLKTYNNKRVPKSAKRCQKVPKKGQQVLKKENIEFILGNKKCQKVA